MRNTRILCAVMLDTKVIQLSWYECTHPLICPDSDHCIANAILAWSCMRHYVKYVMDCLIE